MKRIENHRITQMLFVKSLWLICMFCAITVSSVAQEYRTISGILKDASGEPIPGATITIKGTATGTLTDLNGHYTITAPVGSILVYNFIGMASEEVLVKPVAANSLNEEHNYEKTPFVFDENLSDEDKVFSPFFYVNGDNLESDRMPLKSTLVEVNIAGVIADVEVKQIYVNEGDNSLEAIYVFPGSTNSAVYAMHMKIGERILNAVIKEKQAARQIYEEAKNEGRTASLLEQKRPNVFQMNVANILPGDTIEVVLKYTELLDANDGIYNFVYPTVVGPRYSNAPNNSENWIQNPYLEEELESPGEFHIQVNLNSGIAVKKAYCISHATAINFSDSNRVSIGLSEEEVYGGNRDFILKYMLRGVKVESGILLYQHEDENFFLFMMEPPRIVSDFDINPREYVFIVDVSGSMHGFPLDISKNVMKELLTSLTPKDKFNIMTFAGGNQTLWENSKSASSNNISEGIRFINNQSGGGGTELNNALDKALKMKSQDEYSRTFVVITDGYVSFEKEIFITVRDHLNEANLFALGIGSSTNRYLLDGLAHAGMGEAFVATNPSEGKRVGQQLIEKIKFPVLTDIKMDFGDFNVYDFEPRSIPDVFSQRPVIVYGKYKGNAEGIIKINAYAGSTSYVKYYNLKKAKSENNEALRYLWARNKIKYLDDYAHFYESGSEYLNQETDNKLQKQITDLGLKYNLLTKNTSFVAVDTIVRNFAQKSIQVKQPLPLPQGVSNLAVGNSKKLSTNTDEVMLIPQIESLDEVLVIGYGVQTRRTFTGAITSVESEDVGSGMVVHAEQALKGKVSGMQVINNSGAPGSSSTVRIRGFASNVSNEPLYIVDGIEISSAENSGSSPLMGINTDDIETIEVLKDAASASVYGARASNGVVIITTKKGRTGIKEINFSVEGGVNSVIKPGTDNRISLWYENLLKNAGYQKYNLSYSKGKEKSGIYLSTAYLNSRGVVEKSGIEQYTLVNNLNHQINNIFEIDLNGIESFSKINNVSPVYSDSTNLYHSTLIHSNGELGEIMGRIELTAKPLKGLSLGAFSSINYNNRKYQYTGSELTTGSQLFYTYDFGSILNYRFDINNHGFYTTGIIKREGLYNSSEISFNESNDNPWMQIYDNNYLSAVVRVNYNYGDRYSVRLSNCFESVDSGPENAEFIQLPSLSLAWTVSNEKFSTGWTSVNTLKFRYNLGHASQNTLPLTSLQTPLFTAVANVLDEQCEIRVNSNISRQKTRQNNLGLDLGLFKNRFSFTADLFFNKTKDMYFLNKVFNSEQLYEWINAGDFTNKGFDSELTFKEGYGDFSYEISTNFAVNKTCITKISNEINSDGVFRNIGGYIAGQEIKLNDPIGVYYGYSVESVNETTREITLKDLDGNRIIDNNDRIKIARAFPKFYGGFSVKTDFKGFDIYTGWDYSFGNDIININSLSYYQNFTFTNLPGSDRVLTDLHAESGSYLRLSDLTIGYTLPYLVSKQIHAERIRFSITAKNMLTITSYKGQDPELNNFSDTERYSVQSLPGVDKNYYPVARGFYFAVHAKF